MILLSWISKQKAGEPMSERKTQQELDFERKHEEDLQRIREFRLIDDDFMAAVFEDHDCAEFLLRIILKRDDLIVREVHGQYSIKNLQGRSVRLDILAVDRNNRAYNIEVQRSDRGASEKRARYNSSLLDANLTDSGEEYDALNETYVIFITENDILRAGLPIYHIDRTVQETGMIFNDQAHIIYVNSQIKDETALGKLMHDFSVPIPAKCTIPFWPIEYGTSKKTRREWQLCAELWKKCGTKPLLSRTSKLFWCL